MALQRAYLLSSVVAGLKIYLGGNALTLSEQHYFVWHTTCLSTKRQGMLHIRGKWPLWPPWLRLCFRRHHHPKCILALSANYHL